MTLKEGSKKADDELLKILDDFRIRPSSFTKKTLKAKNRERILLRVFKKEGVVIAKSGSRKSNINKGLNSVIRKYSALAKKGSKGEQAYYKAWVKNLKSMKPKVVKPVVLTWKQGGVQATDEFTKILNKLDINILVYKSKNLSPRNRDRLIRALLKREGIKLTNKGGRQTRLSWKLKQLRKSYSTKVKTAKTEGQKGFFTEWLKKLDGV